MRITINIATHEARKDVLPKAIQSLKNQTVQPDEIRVWDNEQRENLTDRGKFAFLEPETEEIYLTADDDIMYPPDYIERTVEALEKYPRAIVCYHGRKLKGEGLNYYLGHTQFHFLRTLEHDTIIDVPGSGVAAFNTKYFQPNILQYADDCMADLLLGLEAAKQNVKVICLAHDMWWFRSLTDNEGSIYIQERDSCERQGEIADLIWSIKNQDADTAYKTFLSPDPIQE